MDQPLFPNWYPEGLMHSGQFNSGAMVPQSFLCFAQPGVMHYCWPTDASLEGISTSTLNPAATPFGGVTCNDTPRPFQTPKTSKEIKSELPSQQEETALANIEAKLRAIQSQISQVAEAVSAIRAREMTSS